MEKICAWCNEHIGYIKSSTSVECNITHGICNSCAEKINSQMGINLLDFLNELDNPVVMVNNEGIVQTANVNAQKLLQKKLPEINGYLGGEVFDCIYAKEPQGCGNTIHCATCTIRRAVMETFESGISLLKTPALLHTGDPNKSVRIDFLISTEKINNYVLLRVDEVRMN